MNDFLYKKLRAGGGGTVDVVGFAEQKGGTLDGQVLKHFIDNYPDETAARAAHPDAEGWSSKYTDPAVSFNHLPGEDDPVPGGMYPDDLAE